MRHSEGAAIRRLDALAGLLPTACPKTRHPSISHSLLCRPHRWKDALKSTILIASPTRTTVVGNSKWTIDTRYTLKRKIGQVSDGRLDAPPPPLVAFCSS